MITLKRAYDGTDKKDGARILVDHLWPRGVRKETLHLKSWAKDVSPSNQLRTWFAHDPAKWEEFQRRYFAELDQKPETWEPLLREARSEDLTLVFSARDTEHNNALALKNYLETKLRHGPRKRGKRTAD